MSSKRKILTEVNSVEFMMGSFQVRQPLPHQRINNIDPFILLHHAGPTHYEPGGRPQDEGVPPHPHRGFEPVTFVYKGGVHHRDSRGNDSIVGEGGVQWMTAGMGIVHSERPPKELVQNGGDQEIIQLWINLPAKHKMVQPRYQGLTREDIPTVEPDNGAVIQVVAGSLNGVEGPIETWTSVTALNGTFAAGSSIDIDLPDEEGGLIYVLNGSITVNGTGVTGHNMIELGTTGSVSIEASEDSRALILTGAPIGEPVVTSGPFVMNTHTEILEATRDAQMGKMGVLVEDFD